MRVDNTTAVAYINKMGGTLIQMVKEIWMWCKEREINLTTEHLPGKLNHLADLIFDVNPETRQTHPIGCWTETYFPK